MLFGSDFWKWSAFIFELLKLIAKIFGDDEDKEQANNHLSGHTPPE